MKAFIEWLFYYRMAILSIDWRFHHCDGWSRNRIISWRCVENYSIGGVI